MGTNARGDDALADLAAAVGEADRGGSLYKTANALARVVVERADSDEALRMLSAVRPRTWLRLDAELRSLRQFFRPAISGS